MGYDYPSKNKNFGFIRMDPGSSINAENLFVGYKAPGWLFVDGGELEVDNMTLGVHPKTDGYIHLSGNEKRTEMDCKKTAVIGDSGKGEVFVSQGGVFKADRLIVG
jgi:hypothetical protein